MHTHSVLEFRAEHKNVEVLLGRIACCSVDDIIFSCLWTISRYFLVRDDL